MPKSLISSVAAAVALAIVGCGGSTIAKPSSNSHTQPKAHAQSELVAIGAGLKGPAGLKASVYAQGPPTTAAFAFDPAGRLWLTAAGLESHTYDGVYLVAKEGERARRIIAGLEDPLGIDWYRGKLYVASVGRVDAYWGFTGTRFADHQRILNGPEKGAENNLLVTSPNGRLLMGVSATCDHCIPTSKWDGAIVSFKPDGSDLRVYAGRIRAPIGLSYFPGTDDLLVTMNQRDDLGTATPGDWLSVVHEGQDWGFPRCYGQGGPLCAGVPSPLAVLDPHAAVGSVAVITGQLGSSVGTSALVAEWNGAKVQRIEIERSKTGLRKVRVTLFLLGLRNPLALCLTPNHDLLAGDWYGGTIYRLFLRDP